LNFGHVGALKSRIVTKSIATITPFQNNEMNVNDSNLGRFCSVVTEPFGGIWKSNKTEGKAKQSPMNIKCRHLAYVANIQSKISKKDAQKQIK
jgi:hypothetical protein